MVVPSLCNFQAVLTENLRCCIVPASTGLVSRKGEKDIMNPVNRIKDLQKEDRPRERLANVEPSALSNAQLIGIFPGSG
jgi:hypothetical protein